MTAHPLWQGKDTTALASSSCLGAHFPDEQSFNLLLEPVGATGVMRLGTVKEVSHSPQWWRDEGVPAHPVSPFTKGERADSQYNLINQEETSY